MQRFWRICATLATLSGLSALPASATAAPPVGAGLPKTFGRSRFQLAFMSFSSTRSCGRDGPASAGWIDPRSRSIVAV